MAVGGGTEVGAGLAGFSRHRLARVVLPRRPWGGIGWRGGLASPPVGRHWRGEEDGAVYRAGLDFGRGKGYHIIRRLYTSVREGVLL